MEKGKGGLKTYNLIVAIWLYIFVVAKKIMEQKMILNH